MNSWLDHLTTDGGKTFLLTSMLFGILIMVGIMHMTGHDPAEKGIIILTGMVSSIFTKLMNRL